MTAWSLVLCCLQHWTLFQCIWENMAEFYCRVRALFSKKDRRLQELVEHKNIQLFSGNTTWFHFKVSKSAIVYYFIQWILCHSAGILLSKKDEIQTTIFSLVSSWKKEPRTLWNVTSCLILVMSSCCIYNFTHTYTNIYLTLSLLPRILFSKSWPLKSSRKCPEV